MKTFKAKIKEPLKTFRAEGQPYEYEKGKIKFHEDSWPYPGTRKTGRFMVSNGKKAKVVSINARKLVSLIERKSLGQTISLAFKGKKIKGVTVKPSKALGLMVEVHFQNESIPTPDGESTSTICDTRKLNLLDRDHLKVLRLIEWGLQKGGVTFLTDATAEFLLNKGRAWLGEWRTVKTKVQVCVGPNSEIL